MTALAEVYRRGEVILVAAMSQTVDGFWVSSPPRLRLDASASADELGAAVAEALAGSRTGVPNPPVRGGPLPIQPLLELAGVKSWGTFVKGCVLASVEQEKRAVTVEAFRGGRQEFQPVTLQEPLTAPATDTGTLGQRVLAALDAASR